MYTYVPLIFCLILRHLGGPIRGDFRAAVAGQRGTRSSFSREVSGRGSCNQESERTKRD